MSSPPVYLDYAATTPVDPQVLDAMRPYLEGAYGNPSSLHRWGREAKKALENARQSIAANLGAQPDEIYFTSGATEADNLAITGLAQTLAPRGKHIITTAIEHPAVQVPCERLQKAGWDITYLPVNADGFIDLTDLQAQWRNNTVLVSVIHGNNEMGALQPLAEIGKLLKARNILFHSDAVQTVGKLPFNLAELPVDYLSLSGHKIYGPKGVGALYVRKGAPLPQALQVGGGQEADLRSGTENLPGIVGCARALELCSHSMITERLRIQALQEKLIAAVEATIPNTVLNGPRQVTQRVPGNVHFSFPPAEGEALVLHLDLKGFAVSSGSACHSAVIEPSRIIKALGKDDETARATVRFSLGRFTTEDDVNALIAALPAIVSRVAGKSPAFSPQT